jgi:hypothetical protein
MAKELCTTKMEVYMKGSGNKARKMEKEFIIHRLMNILMGSLFRTKLMVMEHSNILMVINILANGFKIKNKEMDCILG